MSRTSWQSLNLSSSSAAQALQAVKSNVTPVIEISKAILKVAQTLSQLVYDLYVDITDISALGLKTAIEIIKTELENAFKDTGLYALPVPIRTVNDIVADASVFLINQIEQPPEYWPTSDKEKYKQEQLAALAAKQAQTIRQQQQAQQQLGDVSSLDTLLAAAPKGNGGNAGFLQTVRESLGDEFDINRPKFNRDDYVGGMVLLYGATSYYEIVKLVKHLAALFKFKIGGLDSQDMPRPKNLTARLEANTAGGTESLYAVKLDWEAAPKAWPLLAYGDVHYDIKKVVVYRSDTPIRKETPLSTLVEVERYDYDGITSHYYDTGWSEDRLGKPIYYAVGYVVEEIRSDGGGEEYADPVDVSTIAIQMPLELASLVSRGVPPDWSAMTLYSLIPPLKDVIQYIKDALDAWLEATQGGKDRIKEFLDFLNKEIQRYSNWALSVLGTIDQIVKMLQVPSATMGLYFFEGRGGNDFFTKTLAEALSDTTDSSRPAFDTGTEMVGGLVLYFGAAYPGRVQEALNTLKTIFGSGGMIEDAFQQASETIDRILTQADAEICLNKQMLRAPCEEEEEESSPKFGPNMQPAEEDALCNRTS